MVAVLQVTGTKAREGSFSAFTWLTSQSAGWVAPQWLGDLAR